MCCLLHVEQCKVFTESVSTIFALSLTSFFYSLKSSAKLRLFEVFGLGSFARTCGNASTGGFV